MPFPASASQQGSQTMAYANFSNAAVRSFLGCSLRSSTAPTWSTRVISPASCTCTRWLPAQPSHCVLKLQSTYGSGWLHLPATSRKLPWSAPARLTAGSCPTRAVHEGVVLLVLVC